MSTSTGYPSSSVAYTAVRVSFSTSIDADRSRARRTWFGPSHGVSTVGGQLVQSWLPDFSTAGAVKKGEVELGPVSVALKATKAAAVRRNIKVAA